MEFGRNKKKPVFFISEMMSCGTEVPQLMGNNSLQEEYIESRSEAYDLFYCVIHNSLTIYEMQLYSIFGVRVKWNGSKTRVSEKMKRKKRVKWGKLIKKKKGYILRVKYIIPKETFFNIVLINFFRTQILKYNRHYQGNIQYAEGLVGWLLVHYMVGTAEYEYALKIDNSLRQQGDNNDYLIVTKMLGSALKDKHIIWEGICYILDHNYEIMDKPA